MTGEPLRGLREILARKGSRAERRNRKREHDREILEAFRSIPDPGEFLEALGYLLLVIRSSTGPVPSRELPTGVELKLAEQWVRAALIGHEVKAARAKCLEFEKRRVEAGRPRT